MDEQELAAIEAHYEAGDRVDHCGEDGCLECFNYGDALVAEVRRLQAELDSLKHSRTLGGATTIGPLARGGA